MSNKKEIKRAVEVAAPLDAAKVQKKQIKADQKSSKKVSKNQEKAAKKSQEYERGEQFQEGQFGGSGAVARDRLPFLHAGLAAADSVRAAPGDRIRVVASAHLLLWPCAPCLHISKYLIGECPQPFLLGAGNA